MTNAAPKVDLVPYTDADMWLTETLETDPRVMAELGGAWPREKIPQIHARRLKAIAEGAWIFNVVPDGVGRPVGGVTIWHSEWDGEPVSETGWMIMPEHQGKGYASAALRQLLERARADGTWGEVHAFPGATNPASNALCRKFGFELLGEIEVDYGERMLRCNHWVLRGSVAEVGRQQGQAGLADAAGGEKAARHLTVER